jgi:hypothetical protein
MATAGGRLLKPTKPPRPSKKSNATNGGGGTHGPIMGEPIMASVQGTPSTVPADQLPIPKPDGVPRDPRYRAAKRAWKVRVCGGKKGMGMID